MDLLWIDVVPRQLQAPKVDIPAMGAGRLLLVSHVIHRYIRSSALGHVLFRQRERRLRRTRMRPSDARVLSNRDFGVSIEECQSRYLRLLHTSSQQHN